MNNNRYAAEINSIVRRAEEEAFRRGYEKGQADKAAEIMSVLNSRNTGAHDDKAAVDMVGRPKTPPTQIGVMDRPASERQRAPKGIVPRFVKRVLSEKPGLTPKEILAEASDEFERMIKPASVRSELRKEGYRSDSGKWFLASDDENDEAEAHTTDAPASILD